MASHEFLHIVKQDEKSVGDTVPATLQRLDPQLAEYLATKPPLLKILDNPFEMALALVKKYGMKDEERDMQNVLGDSISVTAEGRKFFITQSEEIHNLWLGKFAGEDGAVGYFAMMCEPTMEDGIDVVVESTQKKIVDGKHTWEDKLYKTWYPDDSMVQNMIKGIAREMTNPASLEVVQCIIGPSVHPLGGLPLQIAA